MQKTVEFHIPYYEILQRPLHHCFYTCYIAKLVISKIENQSKFIILFTLTDYFHVKGLLCLYELHFEAWEISNKFSNGGTTLKLNFSYLSLSRLLWILKNPSIFVCLIKIPNAFFVTAWDLLCIMMTLFEWKIR